MKIGQCLAKLWSGQKTSVSFFLTHGVLSLLLHMTAKDRNKRQYGLWLCLIQINEWMNENDAIQKWTHETIIIIIIMEIVHNVAYSS